MGEAGISVWWPVIVSAAVQLIGIGTIYGSLRTTLKHQEEEIANLRNSDREQWKQLDEHGEQIGYLKGRIHRA